MMTWGFFFSPIPDAGVRDFEIRFDAPPPYVGHVTRLYVDNIDREGAYIRNIMLSMLPGSALYVESGSGFANFTIADKPIERVGLVEIPVVCTAASATIDPGPVDVSLYGGPARVERARPRDAATDPDLVTLDTAKMHLRITDAAHDADVLQKLRAASATIRDYLKDRNDPTWTPTTVPPWIASAVLLLLAHLYEHRGDQFGNANDNDDRVWSAIANLCRRSRDPALA